MEIKNIMDLLNIPITSAILILILSLIKIPKIELNLWGLIGKAIGKGLNGEVLKEISDLKENVNKVKSTLDEHIIQSAQDDAKMDRNRILRFSDEIICGQEHTKEHYRDILKTIDSYEDYCKNNPDFPNNRCLIAIDNIKESYRERCQNSSFITLERNKL